MRVGELVDQARLAHPGLAHDRDHLSVPRAGSLQRLPQLLDLGVPSHEAREPRAAAA